MATAMRGLSALLLSTCCWTAATGQDATVERAEAVRFFERRIRPALVEHCHECHSAQSEDPEGQLRVDSRAALLRGGVTGPAVVPGHPEKSLLVSALQHDGLEMPPGQKLPDRLIADFIRWIRDGAVDPRDSPQARSAGDGKAPTADAHWAFQPVGRPKIPDIPSALRHRAQTPVDQFVLRKLEQHGLTLAPRAHRAQLVRRATFDLLGLPPTPAEVRAFVSDPRPDAFARLVDRLLDSPRYGEHWGRHWLDVARYADNKGYVFFEDRNFAWAWTYRDYVIAAFNSDLPYDRFLVEQLAADRLVAEGSGGRDALAAMGFVTLGPRFMNNAHDIIDDRIDVVSRGLLGLTVTCARCHDHKYDPISQDDYYALYGVFRSSQDPLLPPQLQAASNTDEYRVFQAGMQERLQKLDEFIATQREQIMRGARERLPEYLMAVHRRREHPATENFMLITDHGALNPAVIQRWEQYLKRMQRGQHPVWTPWHAFAAIPADTFEQQAEAVRQTLLDDKPALPVNAQVRRALADQRLTSMQDVADLYGRLFADVDARWQAACAEDPSVSQLPEAASEELRLVLYGAGSPPMIPRELSWGFLDLLPDRQTQKNFKQLLKDVETWSREQPGAPPRAMTLSDRAVPYDPVVFVRGNPNREGRAVSRRFLQVLSPGPAVEFENGSGRLELARCISDPQNPLTARVIVNRIWLHHFGTGLVATPSDFGVRGSRPSHPELLDWLAREFLQRNWSIKSLHRLILQSAVYQQSGTATAQVAARAASTDPENRLLWRFPRRRLEFETLRDALLSVSGALDQRMGGTPVDLFDGFTARRAVYGFIDRMDLPGLMRAFDFPDPTASSPQRERTTTAPQALFFLNHDFVAECAAHLRQRLRTELPDEETDDRQRIEWLYQVLFARDPSQQERAWAQRYLDAQGDAERAWQRYLQALLMTNEFVFVD